ncbi:MAG: UDP-N-acetylmuramate dehydrogenase [Anaerolineae bacterium]|nr:UDP-N-acetylmuramate dehydrogenase [Anaerolineae bacterium]
MTDFHALQARFGDDFAVDEPLSRYTVAQLGGPASALVRVRHLADLQWAVRWAHHQGLAWRMLGGGANVLVSDEGFRGLVIINKANQVIFDPQKPGIVTAESGANLSTLVRRCMAKGLKGLEWGVNVPGTVGGAVVNNAGAHGGDMHGNLLDAQVLDLQGGAPSTSELNGELWSVEAFEYAYRHSKLKGQHGRYGVLSARLRLEPGHDPAELTTIADGFVAHRKATQPPGASLGSMFKNPPGDYAGRLIEAAGLKGQQMGGVQISPVHANFFVNVGGGSAADYLALIRLAQQTVQARFGVALELEIEWLGLPPGG